MMDKREIIVRRVAQEFKDGDVVNLGIGMPTEASNYVAPGVQIWLQAESGMIGCGPEVEPGNEDPDLIDASGAFITAMPGAAFFDSTLSFAMIRGGHVDITVIGALQVDEAGNLASYMIPGKRMMGMGGAMDLVVGAKRVIIAMEHLTKTGDFKLMKRCTMPLTGIACVDLVVTDLCVLEFVNGQLHLRECFPGVSPQQVLEASQAHIEVPAHVGVMKV
ncbi:MAG: 3-oxoacid CoA-transferase subunit B [Propionibacteriaceae bacterium]|nr:3-oxoacid CoA-transferase subunit B [Propionibacteriaceae bacterium]